MPTTIATLKGEIRNALNRGSLYDGQFDAAIRDAIELVEQNNSFFYMEYTQVLTLPAGVASLNVTWQPNNTDLYPKEILQVRRNFESFEPIPKVLREQLREQENADPTGWIQVFSPSVGAYSTLRFDNAPTEAREYEVIASFYTSADPELLACVHPTLLKAQAMLYLTPIVRSEVLERHWTRRRDEVLKIALIADENVRHENVDTFVQPYAAELVALRGQDLDL